MADTPYTIVLIHGLWMTPRSWEHWAERYKGNGYNVLAPAWPGMEGEGRGDQRGSRDKSDYSPSAGPRTLPTPRREAAAAALSDLIYRRGPERASEAVKPAGVHLG
jgi:pimeloyl-ACP methyl ester carboxylesterase